jgi:hypothetical protein
MGYAECSGLTEQATDVGSQPRPTRIDHGRVQLEKLISTIDRLWLGAHEDRIDVTGNSCV